MTSPASRPTALSIRPRPARPSSSAGRRPCRCARSSPARLRVAGIRRPIIPGPAPLIKLAALPLRLLPSAAADPGRGRLHQRAGDGRPRAAPGPHAAAPDAAGRRVSPRTSPRMRARPSWRSTPRTARAPGATRRCRGPGIHPGSVVASHEADGAPPAGDPLRGLGRDREGHERGPIQGVSDVAGEGRLAQRLHELINRPAIEDDADRWRYRRDVRAGEDRRHLVPVRRGAARPLGATGDDDQLDRRGIADRPGRGRIQRRCSGDVQAIADHEVAGILWPAGCERDQRRPADDQQR